MLEEAFAPYDTQKKEASENSDASLFADKGIRTLKRRKSFRPPFSKGGAVEAAEASSRSAERETLPRRFSFVASLRASFTLAPTSCKRKAAKKLMQFQDLQSFVSIHEKEASENSDASPATDNPVTKRTVLQNVQIC